MTIVPLFILFLADAVIPPSPHSHQDAVYTVAMMDVVAEVASARCPDILARADVSDLINALGLTEADRTAVLVQEQRLRKVMNDQTDSDGEKAWCDDIYAKLGPDGRLMRGLLDR